MPLAPIFREQEPADDDIFIPVPAPAIEQAAAAAAQLNMRGIAGDFVVHREMTKKETPVYGEPGTIQRLINHKDVKGYTSKHGTEDVPMPDWLVGLELEIENFDPLELSGRSFGGVMFTTDNSLRNNGIEAITKPIATKHVPGLLSAFFDKYEVKQDSHYSDRCSTHVHFNVLPLTLEQISTICLVYQTVERLLFGFIGNERDQNIYCVPWNQCGLNYNAVSKLESGNTDVFRRWQKYAALNLIPATVQGTIEFRHLHGTCDVKQIVQWISILSKMFEFATKSSLKEAKDGILNMNTVSNYREWMHMVFGKYADVMLVPAFEGELATGVIDTKLMLMAPEKKTFTYDPWFDVPPPLEPAPNEYTQVQRGFRLNLHDVAQYTVRQGESPQEYRDRVLHAENVQTMQQQVEATLERNRRAAQQIFNAGQGNVLVGNQNVANAAARPWDTFNEAGLAAAAAPQWRGRGAPLRGNR